MRLRMPWTRAALAGVLAASATVAGGLALLSSRTEAKGDARIIPLDKKKKQIYGRTAGDWSAEWWQWMYSIPVSVHPAFDETGALVEVGQRGPVWFLIGTVNQSGSVTRTATIPAGKALLVPILNVEWDNVGAAEPLTVDQMYDKAAEYVGNVDLSSMFFEVDGTPVAALERQRVVSGVFQYAMPEDNIGQYFGQGTTRGIYAPAVADGYWVMLNPLPVGEHTLHYGGTVGAPVNYTLDSTYYLTVVESNRP